MRVPWVRVRSLVERGLNVYNAALYRRNAHASGLLCGCARALACGAWRRSLAWKQRLGPAFRAGAVGCGVSPPFEAGAG